MPAATPETAVQSTPTPRRSRKWHWLLIACVVLVGVWWWWHSHQAAKQQAHKQPVVKLRAPAQYFALEPAFVVNLVDEDAVRYLQADVQLMTRDADTRIALEQQAPALRNRLLLLFGQQSSAQLGQRSGKERLQEKALAEVRQVLKHEGGADKVEAVIFTSLVTQ